MATRYVDLSVDNHGSSPWDTPANYMGWLDFKDQTGTDTFRIRGSRDLGGSGWEGNKSGVTYIAWDVSLYGPWRLKSSNKLWVQNAQLIEDCILEGGTESFNHLSLTNPIMRRCYLRTASIDGFVYGAGALEDCTIVWTGLVKCYHDHTWDRCVFANQGSDALGASLTGTQTVQNSASNAAALGFGSWPNLFFDDDGNVSAGTGGNSWGETPAPAPSWNDADLTKFDLIAGYGVGAPGSWAAAAAIPSWDPTYPKTGTIGGTDAQFLVQTDINSTAYFVVVPRGDTPAPDTANVIAGEDGSGTSVPTGYSGDVSLTGGVEGNTVANNLTSETDYDAYLVAEAVSPQASPVKVEFSTTDVTEPNFLPGYPSAIAATEEITTHVKLNEDGNCYVVVLLHGESAPSSAEVKAGTGAGGAEAEGSGSTPVTANVEASITILGLTPGTAYDVWVVAEDTVPNLQTLPTKLEKTTESTGGGESRPEDTNSPRNSIGNPNYNRVNVPRAGGLSDTQHGGDVGTTFDNSAGDNLVNDNDGDLPPPGRVGEGLGMWRQWARPRNSRG